MNVSCAYFCLASLAFQKHCIYLMERQITYSGTLNDEQNKSLSYDQKELRNFRRKVNCIGKCFPIKVDRFVQSKISQEKKPDVAHFSKLLTGV